MNSSVLTSDLFNRLLDVIWEQGRLATGLVGVNGKITAISFDFPGLGAEPDWDFAGAGFPNVEDFYASMYAKLGTGELADEECMIVYFPEEVPPGKTMLLRSYHVSYLVFHTVDGLKVLYSVWETDCLKMIAKAIPLEQLDAAEREKRQQQLEAAFYLLLKKGGVELDAALGIPEMAQPSEFGRPEAELLEELLILLTRDEYEEEYIRETAADLCLAYNEPEKFMETMEFDAEKMAYYAEEGYEYLLVEYLRGVLDELELICYSDWKFDAEEIEAGLDGLVEEELDLGLDKVEVYSHDLFPLLDQSLQNYELELLNFATDGDYYNFLLVRRQDTTAIIRLCQRFMIPIDRAIVA